MDLKLRSVKVGPERTNCYVVSTTNGETVVIDPGAEFEKIEELLKPIKDFQLKYILLTHGHFDHVGAVDELRRAYPNVPVYLSENDMRLYRELPEQGVFIGRFIHPQYSEIEAIRDGEFLPFGETEIEVIATPGHTPGGVSFRLDNMLFTGDTLFYHTIGRTDLPLSSDHDMNLSLDRLIHLNSDLRVLPGHGKETTIGEEKRNNPFVKEGFPH